MRTVFIASAIFLYGCAVLASGYADLRPSIAHKTQQTASPKRPQPPPAKTAEPSIIDETVDALRRHLDHVIAVPYLWLYVTATLAALILLKLRSDVQDKISSLQGAAWELVRLMENTTPDGPRERARIAEDTAEKFAVAGNARITRPSLVSGDATTTDLTAAGLSLMERHAADAAQFRASRSALRAGIAVFLSLMVYKNTSSAFVAMTEYMRRQRDKRDVPNFAELKIVFGLPVEPPPHDKQHKRGLSRWDYLTIWLAVQRNILRGLQYHPPIPEGATPVVATGNNILLAMRAYLHTSNTYDAARGTP